MVNMYAGCVKLRVGTGSYYFKEKELDDSTVKRLVILVFRVLNGPIVVESRWPDRVFAL